MKKLSTLVAILIFAILISPALGAPSEVSLQKNLDKEIDIKISDKPIEEAFEKLADATGIEFKLDKELFNYLPYGEETSISIGIPNASLREALPAITSTQGLTWQIKEDHILISPTPALKRFGRRATFKELAFLSKLLTTRSKPIELLNITPRQFLSKRLKDKSVKIIIPKFLENVHKALNAMTNANQALPGTLAEWLDMYCESGDLTWYIKNKTIILLSKKAQIQRQLNKKVDLDMQGVKLIDILTTLKNKADITMKMTPGVMLLLPAKARNNFSIKVKQSSIEEILQYIQGTTGLIFELTTTGISVKPSQYLTRNKTINNTNSGSPNYFLQFKLKSQSGAEIIMYILPGQLPIDVQKELERQRQNYIEDLKKTLRKKARQP